MIPVKHIDPEDLPLYAMQLLSPEEHAELTIHLQHSPEARRILADIQGDLAVLAHTAEMEAPAAAARQRLMKHVAREKKPVPIDRAMTHPVAVTQPGSFTPRETELFEEEIPEPSAFARILPWAGWAVAAGTAFSAFYMHDQTSHLNAEIAAQKTQLNKTVGDADIAKLIISTMQDPTATRVTLVQPSSRPAPQARTSYDSEKGSLVFLASNLEPLQPYKTYELWLIPADGRDPIPAGMFKPDNRGYASVILPALPRGVAAKGFGVTIEDDGGAVSPTLPIVLAGKPV